jgi:hypothetical protein
MFWDLVNGNKGFFWGKTIAVRHFQKLGSLSIFSGL